MARDESARDDERSALLSALTTEHFVLHTAYGVPFEASVLPVVSLLGVSPVDSRA